MTGPGHYRQAERLIEAGCDYGCPHTGCEHHMAQLAEAQVHATLALAAATAPFTPGPREQPQDHDYEHSEVYELGTADVEFLMAARRALPPLLRFAEAIRALCMDTDGGWLPAESQLPVGEFRAALALLDDGPSECPSPPGPDRRCYECATAEELAGEGNGNG